MCTAPYLSPKTFAPFAIVQKSHGFIPNFFRAQTLRPDLLEAELEAVDRILLPEDVLTRVQKECILLAVSAANLNSYCVAMHCNLLRGLGMPSEEGDQIAVDHHESNLSEPDRALTGLRCQIGNTCFGRFLAKTLSSFKHLVSPRNRFWNAWWSLLSIISRIPFKWDSESSPILSRLRSLKKIK